MNKIYITIIVVLLGTTAFGGYKWYQYHRVNKYVSDTSGFFGGAYILGIDKTNGKKYLIVPHEYELIHAEQLEVEYGSKYYPNTVELLAINGTGTTTDVSGYMVEIRKKTEIK